MIDMRFARKLKRKGKNRMNNAFNEITEVCPHCESEITMQWSIKESGYKAYCPVCGKRLMLCTACHDDGYACDYDTDTDSCRFSYPEFSIFDGLEAWEE